MRCAESKAPRVTAWTGENPEAGGARDRVPSPRQGRSLSWGENTRTPSCVSCQDTHCWQFGDEGAAECGVVDKWPVSAGLVAVLTQVWTRRWPRNSQGRDGAVVPSTETDIFCVLPACDRHVPHAAFQGGTCRRRVFRKHCPWKAPEPTVSLCRACARPAPDAPPFRPRSAAPCSLETLLPSPAVRPSRKREKTNTSLAEFRFGNVGFMTSVLFCFDH